MEANHILALVGGVTLFALAVVAFAGLVIIGAQIGRAICCALGLTK